MVISIVVVYFLNYVPRRLWSDILIDNFPKRSNLTLTILLLYFHHYSYYLASCHAISDACVLFDSVPWSTQASNGLCVISRTPCRPPIFFGAVTQTQDKTTATMAYRPPPHSSWTDAVQSCLRDARRNQSHQRTQWNVLWQRGGRGRRRGWVAAALLP